MELLHFTGQVWRPPYEASSQLLQVTAGCTHNKCKFCSLYHGTKLRLSPITEVEEDLKVIYQVIDQNRFLLCSEHYLPILFQSIMKKTSVSTSLKLKSLFQNHNSIFLNS